MALTIKTLGLYSVSTASTGSTTIYTVPSGKAAIVGSIVVTFTGSSPYAAQITVTISGGGGGTVKVLYLNGVNASMKERITLKTGDTINCNVTSTAGGSNLVVSVNGFERDV